MLCLLPNGNPASSKTRLKLFLHSAYAISFLLLFLPASLLAQQSNSPRINKEDDLLTALLVSNSSQQSAVHALLDNNSSLVTEQLWNKLTNEALATYYGAKPEQALSIYEIAKQVAGRLNDKRLLALSHFNIARTHSGFNNMRQAADAYLESEKTFEEAGLRREIIYVLADLGKFYLYWDDYIKAKDYSEQSIALAEELSESKLPAATLPDEYGVAVALSNLGNISKWEGDYTRALEFLEKALALYQRLDNNGPKYGTELADCLASMGRVYRVMGDNRRAVSYFNKALKLSDKLDDKTTQAETITSLGLLYYEQGNYSAAVELFNQSLKIYRSHNDLIETARALANLGSANLRQGNSKRALEYYLSSLKAGEALPSKHADSILIAQQGIGAVQSQQGDYGAALEWLGKALATAQHVGDKTRTAEIMWRTGETYYLMGDYPKAIASTDRAVDLARQLRLPVISYLALAAKGRIHLAEKKYDLAFRYLSQAIEQIEAMRPQVAGREEDRQLFFENKVAAYHTMIELLVGQKRVEEAFHYAERAKGRVLFDVLSNGKVNVTEALTSQEKEEERRLNRAILKLNKQMREEKLKKAPDADLLNSLEAQLSSARLEYESFQNALDASRPDPNLRLAQAPALRLEGGGTFGEDYGTAFLEYVVTKEKIYLFVLTKQEQNDGPELSVYPLDIKEEDLTGRIGKFHRSLANRHPAFAELSREIYDLLVKPAESQLRGKDTLCVIPDGALWNLPFQATRLKTDSYLIEEFALYYAPSLSVLKEIKRRAGAESKLGTRSLIAFGNPSLGGETITTLQDAIGSKDFAPLPDAEVEVRTLGRMFSPGRRKMLTGAEANEPSFKSLAPSYDTIHLATHGILDDLNPLYSYLILSKAEGDADDDGLLEAREILRMNLLADMVVLSACQTARGRVSAGEGVIGMSWAFIMAGCRTTVVSQWKVNSASTSKLMINFYRHLKSEASREGGTKANALRLAALELMKDQRDRHPFYWAGFVMIGSNG